MTRIMSIEEEPMSHEALLADLYSLQASLKILADQLARTRHPELDHKMLSALSALHWYMLDQQPSLRRH